MFALNIYEIRGAFIANTINVLTYLVLPKNS